MKIVPDPTYGDSDSISRLTQETKRGHAPCQIGCQQIAFVGCRRDRNDYTPLIRTAVSAPSLNRPVQDHGKRGSSFHFDARALWGKRKEWSVDDVGQSPGKSLCVKAPHLCRTPGVVDSRKENDFWDFGRIPLQRIPTEDDASVLPQVLEHNVGLSSFPGHWFSRDLTLVRANE